MRLHVSDIFVVIACGAEVDEDGVPDCVSAASAPSDYSDVSDYDEPTYAARECDWCGSGYCDGPDMCGH